MSQTGRPGHKINTADMKGKRTVLTERCYLYHTSPDRDQKDVETRIRILPKIPRILQQPRLVLSDVTHIGKVRYIDIEADLGIAPHVIAVIVVVDPGKDPQEIVTWMVKRELTKEDLSGGVLYDSHDDPKPPNKV